jgi:methylated-DNA-protein-cysteine methyltransferase related protein
MNSEPTQKERIIACVSQIPEGKITSYGHVGALCGANPRVVGFVLSGLNDDQRKTCPWQRVVNRNAFISASKLGSLGDVQQAMLEQEGIEVKEYQIINPEKYWWNNNYV